jgi:hypothetical protein
LGWWPKVLGDFTLPRVRLRRLKKLRCQKFTKNSRLGFIAIIGPRRASHQFLHHNHIQPSPASLIDVPLRITLVD